MKVLSKCMLSKECQYFITENVPSMLFHPQHRSFDLRTKSLMSQLPTWSDAPAGLEDTLLPELQGGKLPARGPFHYFSALLPCPQFPSPLIASIQTGNPCSTRGHAGCQNSRPPTQVASPAQSQVTLARRIERKQKPRNKASIQQRQTQKSEARLTITLAWEA